MSQNDKILKLAESCTIFDFVKLNDVDIPIKTRFLNAVLCRWESKFTQDDVAEYLECSKRTVAEIEKGQCNNLVLVFNYIHLFGRDIAQDRLRKARRKYYLFSKR